MTVLLHTAHATLYDFGNAFFIRLRTGLTSALSTTGFRGGMQQRVHQSWVRNSDEVKQCSLILCH